MKPLSDSTPDWISVNAGLKGRLILKRILWRSVAVILDTGRRGMMVQRRGPYRSDGHDI